LCSFSQTFTKFGDGLNVRTFYHQQGINYYLSTSDTNKNVYGIYYDTVSSSFNFGNEFTQIRLQIYNGLTWLYSKPVKLYNKQSIDAPRVLDLKHVNGKIWISGSFDSSENNMGGGVLVFNGVNWESAQIKLYQTYKDYFEVRQILNVKNQILLTGNFDSIKGVKCNGIVYYDGVDWGPIGKTQPYGFSGVSSVSNVFFNSANDSLYVFNKNKISPDSIDISGRTYRKLAVLRNHEFEQIKVPFAHIAAINSFNKKLLIIPTSNLIYISRIAILNNNSWNTYSLKDSFYATNYIGGFEQRSNLYLFFQNPTLSQIDVFRFNGSEIIKLKSFKIANQYINLNFNEDSYLHIITGPITEVKQDDYVIKTNKIIGIDYLLQPKVYGTTFKDLNNDGIKQINEGVIANCKVYDLSNRYMTISNSDGVYEMELNKGNNYFLRANNEYGFEAALDYPLMNPMDSLYNLNIGLFSKNENDVKIKIISHTGKRAKQGFVSRYEIQISNFSGSKFSGNITVEHMPKLKDLKFENFTVLNQNKTSFSFFTSIESNQTNKLLYSCIYAVDSFALNDLVKTNAKLFSIDSKTSNNFDTLIQTVVSAFDPNIKEAFPNELVNIDKEINYTIWFQNEGNDTALNVCVVDSFGSLFSLKDIHITTDSKGGTIIPDVRNNCLIWNFKNIMLPPKSVDSIKSIGFVSFRTKLNPQAKIGDTIYNKASIYFDYQKPIITNKAKVYFAKNVLISRNNTQENLTVYPNPNNGKLYINIEPNKTTYLELINSQGQTVFNYTITNREVIIEIPESIANGIYFIKCDGILYRSEPILLIR
jgi:hypothetical protein